MMRLRRICRYLRRAYGAIKVASTVLGLWIILRDLL
jgi:hypothetical protein